MRDYEELVSCLRIEADGLLVDDKPDMLLYDSLRDAADAIEELSVVCRAQKAAFDAYMDKMPKWISVEDALPDDHVRVLLCNDDGKMITGERAEDDWWYCYFAYDVDRWDVNEQGRVIAWMPLPEPPKEDDNA